MCDDIGRSEMKNNKNKLIRDEWTTYYDKYSKKNPIHKESTIAITIEENETAAELHVENHLLAVCCNGSIEWVGESGAEEKSPHSPMTSLQYLIYLSV